MDAPGAAAAVQVDDVQVVKFRRMERKYTYRFHTIYCFTNYGMHHSLKIIRLLWGILR